MKEIVEVSVVVTQEDIDSCGKFDPELSTQTPLELAINRLLKEDFQSFAGSHQFGIISSEEIVYDDLIENQHFPNEPQPLTLMSINWFNKEEIKPTSGKIFLPKEVLR